MSKERIDKELEEKCYTIKSEGNRVDLYGGKKKMFEIFFLDNNILIMSGEKYYWGSDEVYEASIQGEELGHLFAFFRKL